MTEIALVVMAVLFGGIAFALGLFVGFYASARAITSMMVEGMRDAGLEDDQIERIASRLQRGKQ